MTERTERIAKLKQDLNSVAESGGTNQVVAMGFLLLAEHLETLAFEKERRRIQSETPGWSSWCAPSEVSFSIEPLAGDSFIDFPRIPGNEQRTGE